ncbi:DUF4147 domain-containing protein [bacterium]|nr:DUF4147 domain-containing protein [bacterium]
MKSIVAPLLHSFKLLFHNPHSTPKQTLIVATGKAAALMYQQFCEQYPHYLFSNALLIIPEGYPLPESLSSSVQLIETTHPFISERSLDAGQKLVEAIASSKITTVVALVSGGSSAAVELLDDRAHLSFLNSLITSHKSIVEINAIRAEHSLIKGGKLAMMFPQKTFSVAVMSDIPALDGYKMVGSMPFYSSLHLKTSIYEVASSQLVVTAVEEKLQDCGYTIRFSTPYFMDTHRSLVALVKKQMHLLQSGEAAIIAGESTLAIEGKGGKGGRMSHLLLSVLDTISDDISIEAFATDGVDGNSLAAGGVIPFSALLLKDLNVTGDFLRRFDSGTLINNLGFSIEIEATGLNLNDIVIILKKESLLD